MIKIILNGRPHECKEGITIIDLLSDETCKKEVWGVAIAVNDSIVHREEWKKTKIKESDIVEIVYAVQGG